MAYRIDAGDVAAVLTTDLADEQIEPFVLAANLLVSRVLADVGYSDDELKEIERYLAAHYLASTLERETDQESIAGEYSATYAGETGKNLEGTRYGQVALSLDWKGKLSQTGKKRARFTVNG